MRAVVVSGDTATASILLRQPELGHEIRKRRAYSSVAFVPLSATHSGKCVMQVHKSNALGNTQDSYSRQNGGVRCDTNLCDRWVCDELLGDSRLSDPETLKIVAEHSHHAALLHGVDNMVSSGKIVVYRWVTSEREVIWIVRPVFVKFVAGSHTDRFDCIAGLRNNLVTRLRYSTEVDSVLAGNFGQDLLK